MAKRVTKCAKYKYNIITTQKGRAPLWTPEEALAILDAVEAGNLVALEQHNERILRYIDDRCEQLHGFGLTEIEPVPLFAAAVVLVNKDFHDYREYLHHVRDRMLAGEEYIMPDEWQRMNKAKRGA